MSADGGGDYPESPEIGLKDALDLSWRADPSVAKLVFWVADAPHHADKAPDMLADMRRANQLDVHLYPVAASGADILRTGGDPKDGRCTLASGQSVDIF